MVSAPAARPGSRRATPRAAAGRPARDGAASRLALVEIQPVHAGVLARLLGELGEDFAGLARIEDRLGLRSLVPALGDGELAVAGLEDAAGDLAALLAHQPRRDRRDPFRTASLLVLFGVVAQVLGHTGEGRGRNRIHRDAVAAQFARRDHRERGDARFRRTVVGLADIAVDARYRGRRDDARIDRSALGLG